MSEQAKKAEAALRTMASARFEPSRIDGEERYRIDLGGETRAFTVEELIEIAEACAAGKSWDELEIRGEPAGTKEEPEPEAEQAGSAPEPAPGGEPAEPNRAAEESGRAALLNEEERAAAIRNFEKFTKKFPDVLDLPVEVVEAVRGGDGLLDAYLTHENTALKSKVAALEKNESNARRAAGSARGEAGDDEDTAELMAIFDSIFR